MSLGKDLKSFPPAQWVTRKAVIFDWSDGPREGVCSLARPLVEFSFELLVERHNPDDLDDRLFRLKELPAGSVDGILNSLAELGPPDKSIWMPVWKFPNACTRQEADQQIHEILSRAQVTPVVIATRDLEHFLGCWLIDPNSQGNHDWFSALGVSQQQSEVQSP